MENIDRQKYHNKPGIYRIYNILNNKSYIGSSNSLYKRINGHINSLIKNCHHSAKLQNSFNKYGIDNFKTEVLLVCEIQELLIQEKHYIDKYDSVNNGFNILTNPERPSHVFTKDQKSYLKTIGKINAVKHRKSLLKRLEIARKSMKENPVKIDWWIGRKHKSESKLKMQISAIKRGVNNNKPIIQMDKTGKEINRFKSSAEAERITGICSTNIGKCCLSKRKTAGKHKWKFENS